MPDDADHLNALAEEFAARVRRGEPPDIEGYARTHPEAAARIRELFPALLLIEGLRTGRSTEAQGPAAQALYPALAPGAAFGGYRIEREIARGGMGIVYEAVHISLEKRVALKVVPGVVQGGPGQLERFLREAKTAAALHHTHIVPVFDMGEVSGLPYYAMQYIDGRSLDAVLQDLGPRATDREGHFRWVAGLGLQAAEGLEYAHSRGVIHRDIKPSNLILDRQGNLWVADFGLARSLGDPVLTGSGQILGTPRYMSPEQACSDRGPVDHRSDIYSLGASLYELLTLKPAFEGGTPHEVLLRILEREPPPPRRIEPAVPRDLETIVMKAMARRAADRYAAAGDLAEDLRRWLCFEPIRARRVSAPERAWRWCRRNPALAALTASVAALLMAVAVVSSAAAVKLRRERNLVLRGLWASSLSQAREIRKSGRPSSRFEGLEAIDRAAALQDALAVAPAGLRELRNNAIACLSLADLRVHWEREAPASEAGAVDFDARLERSAVARSDGSVVVGEVADGRELVQLPGEGGAARSLRFSPDGRFLAVHRPAGRALALELWDLERAAIALTSPAGPYADALDFSPDGTRLAAGLGDGSIGILDLPPGEQRKRLPAPGGVPRAIRFHPSGKHLAVAVVRSTTIHLLDLEAGQPVRHLRHPRAIHCMAWSPAGDLLAVGTSAAGIHVWEAESGRLWARFAGHRPGGGHATSLVFSRAGDLLASSGRDGGTFLWSLSTRKKLLSVSGRALSFGPGDQRLAFVRPSEAIGVWEVADGREYRVFRSRTELSRLYWSLDFSPDGRLMATASHNGLRLWDASGAGELAFLPVGRLMAALFTPDGRSLITAGSIGVHRWPIEAAGGPGGPSVRLGPPALLDGSRDLSRGSMARDGSAVVVVDTPRERALLLSLPDGSRKRSLGPHGGIRSAALSPDGRWAATGAYPDPGLKVWDALDGALAAELPTESSASPIFSPDGRWLVAGTKAEYRFYTAGSWQRSHGIPRAEGDDLPRPAAFSLDGKVMAVAHTRSLIRLVDPGDGSEIATLEGPYQRVEDEVKWIAFTPDASRLATGWRYLRCWDLARIRGPLRRMGLDWDPPGPQPAGDLPAPAPRVTAEMGDFLRWKLEACTREIEAGPEDLEAHQERSIVRRQLGQWREALGEHETLLGGAPGSPQPYQELAWMYLTAPDGLRDPARAETLARRAVELAPKDASSWNVLGASAFRLGRFDQALEALKTGLVLQKGEGSPFDHCFLALTYHRLGERDLALSFYEKVVEETIGWWNSPPSLFDVTVKDLQALRDEVEAALAGEGAR